MKNCMLIAWDILNGSGIEDILDSIYKAAVYRAIMNVHNFNYSLRCWKFICSALSILFFESFVKFLLKSPTEAANDMVTKLNKAFNFVPLSYTKKRKQKEWFSIFVCEIQSLNLSDIVNI